MTDDLKARAEKLLELGAKMSPVPWKWTPAEGYCVCDGDHERPDDCSDWIWEQSANIDKAFEIDMGDYHGLNNENAEALTALRNDAPPIIRDLLAERERLAAEAKRLRAYANVMETEIADLKSLDAHAEWRRLDAVVGEQEEALAAERERSARLAAALKAARPIIEGHRDSLLESSCLLDRKTLEPRRETLEEAAQDDVAAMDACLAQIDAALSPAAQGEGE